MWPAGKVLQAPQVGLQLLLLRLIFFQRLAATLLSLILDTVSFGHSMDPPTPGFWLLIPTLYFGVLTLLRVFFLSEAPLRPVP